MAISSVHNAGVDKASTLPAQSTGRGIEHELLAVDSSARALHWRLPWLQLRVRSIRFAQSKFKTKRSSAFHCMSHADGISRRIDKGVSEVLSGFKTGQESNSAFCHALVARATKCCQRQNALTCYYVPTRSANVAGCGDAAISRAHAPTLHFTRI